MIFDFRDDDDVKFLARTSHFLWSQHEFWYSLSVRRYNGSAAPLISYHSIIL